MPTCRHRGDPSRLALLLSGDLPEAEQAELADHLDSCEPCRKALEALSAGSGLWADLALLRDRAAGEDEEIDPECRDAEAEAITMLDPADGPGMLGRIGRYDILRVVGRGGMGVVFQAVDRSLDRMVAIKLLAPALAASGAARRRFAREAKAAAAVVHEHVVTIHAVDATARGIPYLVMEYVAGHSAQELIDRGRAPTLPEILRIGSQAARGLAAAHAQGLIHRDVKPANILLEDGVERVKLTDFGLARAVDDASMTQSGVVAGTPQYMSPEQARGEAVDHRTDLFSLGSVLYALCVGRAPFRGSSSLATLRRVSEQDPEPIASQNPEVPPWLCSIIARLHAKDPDRRHQAAEEVAELLGRCLAHVQQPGSFPLPGELVPRPNRRRLVAWGSFAACVLLGASLSISEVRAAAQEATEFVATVLRLKTPSGILVVETDDPGVALRLDGSDLIVTGAGVKELRLDVGEHNVQAVKDGEVIREELVTITRGDRTVLSIRREPEETPAVADREPIEPLGGPDAYSFPDAATEADRLAEALRSHPAEPSEPDGRTRMQVYILDLDSGETTLVADEPLTGLTFSAIPDWSPDGRRISFRSNFAVNPGGGRMFTLEAQDGRPSLSRLGPGDSPNFSPDGRLIAFVNWPGSDLDPGVWLMDADGSDRRRVSETVGNPYFSPSSDRLLIHTFNDPSLSFIKDLETGHQVEIKVAGHEFVSWPSWVDDHTLVAPISTGKESGDDRLVLLDVSDPSHAEITRVLWERDPDQDIVPRWPLKRPSTGEYLFVGAEGSEPGNRSVPRNLYRLTPDKSDRAVPMQPRAIPDLMGGLSLSPDGRYLLFNADRPDRGQGEAPGPPAVGREPGAHINDLIERMRPMRGRSPGPGDDAPGGIGPMGGPPAFSLPLPEAATEALRLVEALERHPAEPTPDDGRPRQQLYLRDIEADRVMLVADEPIPGQTWASIPSWSPDGTRIAFNMCPSDDWRHTQIALLERDPGGMPKFRLLGLGTHPSFSPDGRMIAYYQWPGSDGGGGVWLMLADGSGRRQISAGSDSPSWSPDGYRLLLNPFSEPITPRILHLETGRVETILVPGFEVISWPSWVDDRTLVATLNTGRGKDDERLVLLDVSNPSDARIVRILWTRGEGQDLLPRWPTKRPLSDDFYFAGVSGPNLRDLYRLTPDRSDQAVPIQPRARGDSLHGLTFSPDGRYLLFSADRQPLEQVGEDSDRVGGGLLDPVIPPLGVEPIPNAAEEVERLAEALRRHPARPSEDRQMGSQPHYRMQLYMKDLQGGEVALVADEPLTGYPDSFSPAWSPDGTKIAFHASKTFQWTYAELFVLEARDGRPAVTSLGAGSSPAWSPDGAKIAFLLWQNFEPDGPPVNGVWVMDADGSNRRRVADQGAPSWSPDGRKLLINPMPEPGPTRILDLERGLESEVRVEGLQFISWPRWADDRTLVATLNTSRTAGDERLALLDVSDPANAVVRRVLWRRDAIQDLLPRWPTPGTTADEYFFIGVGESNTRGIYRVAGEKPGPLSRAETVDATRYDGKGGLSLSPDGRYLLFNANRPDRADAGR